MTDLSVNESKRSRSDREVLDTIAIYMGAQGSWNGGDVCEVVAELLEYTGRPGVGSERNTAMYRVLADERGMEHDGPDEVDEDDDDDDEDDEDKA